jgi:hypothetical protein
MIPPRPRDAIELATRDLVICDAPTGLKCPDVVVGVAVNSDQQDLSRCLTSVVSQSVNRFTMGVVLLLDTARHDRYKPILPRELTGRTWVLRANCGSPARARNAILEFVEQSLPSCRWLARLDWDDRFAEPDSLAAAVELGDSAAALFVLGGNRVVDGAGQLLRSNRAGRWLRDEASVLQCLAEMAAGTAENELPSCNLLLRNGAGLRYPDTASAEDHWLVADLLINKSEQGVILESVFFADYTIDGRHSADAKRTQRYRAAREALHQAARMWIGVSRLPGRILGLGQEGIVREHDGVVFKHFYANILTAEKTKWLSAALATGQSIAPVPRFLPEREPGSWLAVYPWEATVAFDRPSAPAVSEFLAGCLRSKLVCGNIKRTNFRVRNDGQLVYIDIGNWLAPMDVSVLRDSAARLFSIGVLGASDDELLRRPADPSRPVVWDRLTGFAKFFGGVVEDHIHSHWRRAGRAQADPRAVPRPSGVTLMIKACAMDAVTLREQVRHIVGQLVGPSVFTERVLAIDSHPGPFLRQHSTGNLDELLRIAGELVAEGTIDRLLVAPADRAITAAVNRRWFGTDCSESHSLEGVPVSPQLWAFEQITTRFVLQCDADILVGRRDGMHDYLTEMVEACAEPDVVGVAFNIPHDPVASPQRYDAPGGGFKPEVRCGLLDLDRLRECLPLPNRIVDGRLLEPWYRSLHKHQQRTGQRTLRGGSPLTYYLHPPNALKSDSDTLARIRDLVSQDLVPDANWEKWDVVAEDSLWQYPKRAERLVVVARGRNTPCSKIERFVAGLAMQSDQGFGVIVIDDGSDDASPRELGERLRFLGSRLTLVRHARRRGRMANSVLAIREICQDPKSCIVVVDLDDALADPEAISQICLLHDQGHDVILGAPFRPEAPTKIYEPDFGDPRRKFGGDVWIHLRAFEKELFDRLPDEALQLDGTWLEECDDYAIMIPVVELARSPRYVPEYWYWHERTTGKGPEELARRDATITRILAKPSVAHSRLSRGPAPPIDSLGCLNRAETHVNPGV